MYVRLHSRLATVFSAVVAVVATTILLTTAAHAASTTPVATPSPTPPSTTQAPAAGPDPHGYCNVVGYLCLWGGTGYTGALWSTAINAEWVDGTPQYVDSVDNYRNKWVSWLGNDIDVDTNGGWEACIGIYEEYGNLGNYSYQYVVYPGGGSLNIKNNVEGVFLSNTRQTCPAGSGPHAN